jgi:SAM-dependent methyltransferase
LREFIKSILPSKIWNFASYCKSRYLAFIYLHGKRPIVQAETSKAKNRRLRENFFNTFCQGNGLDIGFGGDLILPNAKGWDFEHGDAQYLYGLEENSFNYVYSSHTLEHVSDSAITLKNWYRVLKSGGYLILYLPHRDLYEKKKELPSIFNPTHKRFFLIDEDDPPSTEGIIPLLKRTLKDFEIIYAKECNEGYSSTDPTQHSNGEYSIEVVVKKKC